MRWFLGFLLLAVPYTKPSQMIFNANVAGSVDRKMSAKLGDAVSVKDFGAVGDGVTNDATALQAALTYIDTNGGALYFPPGTYLIGTTGLTMTAGNFYDRYIYGVGAASTGGSMIKYTGTGTALTIGTTAGETQNVTLWQLGIDLGSAGAGAGAIYMTRVTAGLISGVIITGRTSAPDLGVGITQDGTGGAGRYTGNVIFDNVSVTGNYTKGVYLTGPSSNTCNHDDFRNMTIGRTTAKPGTGTIGIHYSANCGDGVLLNPDVEGYDTAYQIDGAYLRGFARAENNTVAVAFGATSNNNRIELTPFTNTTLASYAVGQAYNSIILPDGFESNLNTGVINSYLTLHDRTDRSVALRLQAGLTAEQDGAIEWYDRAGNKLFQLRKASYGAFVMEDIASGGIPRFTVNGGTNDDTILASAGTGAVTVNTVAGRGTGGFKVGDGAGATNAIISSAGKFTTYNGIATVALGHPTEYGATVALTAQTANLGATNVYASAPVGEYRVCANARTTTSGSGTTANLNIIWTDEGGVKTDAVGTWALNSVTVTGQINKCEFIHAAAATAIQVSVTAGTYGTSVYAISAQVERLQ